MTWSYDTALTAAKDKIRLLVGDTDTSDQLLSNEEIDYLYTANGSDINLAAAEACDTLASKFARQADTKNGVLSVAASQRFKAYTQKAKDLRDRATAYSEVFAGGLSISGKESLADDTDLVQPRITRGMFGSTPSPNSLLKDQP